MHDRGDCSMRSGPPIVAAIACTERADGRQTDRTGKPARRAQAVRQRGGARRRGPVAAGRPGAGAAGRQRRRQEHGGGAAARTRAARRGRGDAVRARARAARCASRRRRDAAVRRAAGNAQGARTARADPQLLPAPAQRRRLRRAGRPRRPARTPLRQAVRRPAAARAVRARRVRQPARAVPGRTHDRPGHRSAADAVARAARPGRTGLRGAADHALPGGSRGAGRPGDRACARPRGRRRRHGGAAPSRFGAAHPLPDDAGRRTHRRVAGGAYRARGRGRHGRGAPRRREGRNRHRRRRNRGPPPARRRCRAVRAGSAARRPGRRIPRTHPRRRPRGRAQGGRMMHAVAEPIRHRALRSYALEAKYEFLHLLRTPIFALPTILFPALFYLLFGVVLNSGNGDAARYLLATYGAFGVMGAGLFGFGVTVAIERERGFLMLKRALPMPPGAYLLARMAMAMLFSAIVSLLLGTLAFLLAGVSLQPGQWALLLLVDVLGALPFCALGLFIGTLVSGNAAPAVVNLIFLPMAFMSGLWLPLSMLPDVLASAAPVWPAYHLGQVALKVVGMDGGSPLALHVGVLAVVTVALFVLARARLARTG